jgi:hypothetical protein
MSFIIISSKRCGSNFFVEYLNNITSISSYGEEFIPNRIYGDKPVDINLNNKHLLNKNYDNFDANTKQKQINKFKKLLWNRDTTNQKMIVGALYKYDHTVEDMTLESLFQLMKENNTKVIHLKRKKYILTYLSLLDIKKKENKGFHNIDINDYISFKDKLVTLENNTDNILKEKDIDNITIYYEDLIDNKELVNDNLKRLFNMDEIIFKNKNPKFTGKPKHSISLDKRIKNLNNIKELI